MTNFDDPVWTPPAGKTIRLSPIKGREDVDLAIVGGGLLGLSTALEAVRLGLSVRVLEAGRIGGHAAGLNGGQVIPGLKQDPESLVARFGEKKGAALVDFVAATADHVFSLIEKEGLDVEHGRHGWIHAAHHLGALEAMKSRNAEWKARGADCDLLDKATVETMTGASGYVGGWIDRRAGVVNPRAFVLELARKAAEAGAAIAEGEEVARLARRADGFELSTRTGKTVAAGHVLAATNAYSDQLVPGLARSMVPLHSFQIATAPLPEGLAGKILPGGQAVSDSRRIIIYYRKSADGRLVFGGRGRMGPPKSAADWAHLERAMIRIFPALMDIAIEKRWFGRVAVTADHLPHLHEPEKGLVSFVGCQGRGLGLMTAMGPKIASYFAIGNPDVLPFPITPISPIPLHAFRQIGVAATIAWYRMLDAREK